MTRGSGAAAAVALAGLLIFAALRSEATPATPDPGPWTMIPPTDVAITGTLADPRLNEASGAALSRANPGLIWTIDDSGNPADLYAIDSTGALKADFSIVGATNVDWEEVALGPCGTWQCVYIADTGDNSEHRRDVVIYRVAEPTVTPELRVTPRAVRGAEWIRLVYPDHPHDVEAMAVTPDGDLLLVTKGRSSGILLFRVERAEWVHGGTVRPTRIDSLPIVPAGGMGREVTGMALSPDGRRLMVRTYRDLYPFSVGEDLRLTPLGKPTGCDILGREPQGEGITFLDAHRLLLTSERGLFKAGTVTVLRCDVE